ncbi:MAG: hypothetical protein ACOX5G_03215 [Kiritimatiellia bacterium]
MPDRIARDAGADIRRFSCASHVLALLYWEVFEHLRTGAYSRTRPCACGAG